MDAGADDPIDEARRGLLGLGAAAGAGALLIAGCNAQGDEPPSSVVNEALQFGTDCLDTYAALRALATPPAQQGAIFVRGRVLVGDGGEGIFFWDGLETTPDNDATVIQGTTNPPPTGRWRRQNTAVTYAGGNRGDFLNVRWFGAKGDGLNDDTIKLQKALDEVRLRGGTLYFPPGRYLVGKDVTNVGLNAGASFGIRYQGAGASPKANSFAQDTQFPAYPEFPTTLVWMGDNATPLFKWCGSSCVFDGIGFQGGFSNNVKPAAIGFLVYRDPTTGAPAAGKAYFPTVQFTQCSVGLQCGVASGDDNCDMLAFGRFGAKDCTTGFKVVNDQGQNFVFQDAKFENIGIAAIAPLNVSGACFDFANGGVLDVIHMHGANTALLLNVHPSTTNPGTSAFRFGYIKLDAQQTQRVVWVKHTGSNDGLANIVIEGGSASNISNQDLPAGGIAAFQVQGQALLTVRNVNGGLVYPFSAGPPVFPAQPMFQLTSTDLSRTTTATFESCSLGDFDPLTSSPLGVFAGPGSPNLKRWQLLNCYRGPAKHTRVPDLGNLRGLRTGTFTFAATGTDEFTITVPHGVFGATVGLDDNVFPQILLTPVTQTIIVGSPPIVWVTSVGPTSFIAKRATGGISLPVAWRAEIVV